MTGYFGEFARNWRPLSAAFVGMAAGYTINNYLNNLFIPSLMREFEWRPASVALLSAAATLSLVCQPIAGRLTDRFGVRPVALFGVLAGAVIFLALSVMTGAFWTYAVLVVAQIVFVASTTAAVVYSRPVAQSFTRARGLALALAISAPSLAGAIIVSPLTAFIDANGWRAGFRLVALVTLIVGLCAVWLAGGYSNGRESRASAAAEKLGWRTLVANANFRLILTGMALCSLSIMFQTTQLKVALIGAGLASSKASALIGVYALGVIGGRLASGVALDVLPARVVTTFAMALPSLGLFILAAGSTDPALLTLAVLTIGLSLGAEGDIAGYLVISYLPPRIYSTACGIVIGSISFAAGIGALMLSTILAVAGTYGPFLWICGGATLLGGALFALLRHTSDEMSVSSAES